MLSYEQALELITSKDNFYINLGLDRISEVLKILGNPQNKLKFIHVAGTNGKGSVCAMLDSILREAGYKTGLYTSPHIWDYTERITVNGEPISKIKFADYTEKILDCKIHLTEFEILTVMMFLYFEEEKVDLAIIEAGLGGRLDATNVIKQNLASIITHIDLDHTDKLGETKEKIAFEKAGIIKKNCPVITAMGYESIKNKADEMNSLIISAAQNVPQIYSEALVLKGIHQQENLALVLTTTDYLFKNIQQNVIIEGLRKVKHPCRFEYIKNKNLIIDASHNPNGIMALRKNLDLYFPDKTRRFVFGCLKTKDYKNMMKILFKKSDEIYINEFKYPNVCSYEELSKSCPYKTKRYNDSSVLTKDKLNIICGSFYMIGTMKNLYD